MSVLFYMAIYEERHGNLWREAM